MTTFSPGDQVWTWEVARGRWIPGLTVMAVHEESDGQTLTVSGPDCWPIRVYPWRVRTEAPDDLRRPPERPAGQPMVAPPMRRPRVRVRAR